MSKELPKTIQLRIPDAVKDTWGNSMEAVFKALKKLAEKEDSAMYKETIEVAQEKIAEMCGYSRQTVNKRLHQMAERLYADQAEETPLIEIERVVGQGGKTIIHLNWMKRHNELRAEPYLTHKANDKERDYLKNVWTRNDKVQYSEEYEEFAVNIAMSLEGDIIREKENHILDKKSWSKSNISWREKFNIKKDKHSEYKLHDFLFDNLRSQLKKKTPIDLDNELWSCDKVRDYYMSIVRKIVQRETGFDYELVQTITTAIGRHFKLSGATIREAIDFLDMLQDIWSHELVREYELSYDYYYENPGLYGDEIFSFGDIYKYLGNEVSIFDKTSSYYDEPSNQDDASSQFTTLN